MEQEKYPTPQVICMGEALVDILAAPRGRHLKDANRLVRAAGGAPANVAVALARLGTRSAFLGKVGADPFGQFLKETLEREGVDTTQMFLSSATNTGLAFAWVDNLETGDVKYLFYRGAAPDRLLEVGEIDWGWFAGAQVLQHSSLTLADEPGATAIRTAINRAQDNGQLICYDVNMRLPAWPDRETARSGMLAPLETSDIVKLNRFELAFLAGTDKPEEGLRLLRRTRNKLQVVTLDSDGCFFQTENASGYISPFPVRVADAVGAGDAFVAGLLARILQTGIDKFDYNNPEQVSDACRYANAAGALAVTRPGAIPAMPTLRQVNRFLNQFEGGKHALP